MTKYDIVSLIIAIIALCVSIIPLIASFFKFLKNRLTTKSLQVEVSDMVNDGGWNTDWLHCDLTITNHTRKEFTVGRIIVTANGKFCKVWQSQEKINMREKPVGVVAIPPIRLMAHDTAIIDFYIVSPFRIEKPNQAILSLVTPYKKLDYPILLSVERRNDDSDNKTDKC